jgi:hypothetical protein
MGPATSADNGVKNVRGISSDVVLDPQNHDAIKRYRRQPLIAALYRLVFQAPFPYVSNIAALKAAKYRRRIAGLITKYLLGRDVVAPVKRVEPVEGGYLFVTELVNGTPPRERKRARAFLHEVTDAFIKSGLPTWQVSPHNPRSLGNLMETPDGDYRIIDLESNVVTPMVPVTEIWGAASTLHLPPFDDIDVPRLIRFYEENRSEIRHALGEEGAQELTRSIARYMWYEDLWQKNEPRIFSRALRKVVRFLDLPAHVRAIVRTVKGWGASGTQIAERWAETGIERWKEEGVITQAQAARARADLQSGPIVSVLGHLGAHMAMSIPLRFPLGSAARLIWSGTFRVRAEVRAAFHRADPAETRTARGIHSVPVIAVSAIPGLGAAAYVLAAPLRRNAILLGAAADQAFRLIPFKLYERLHLRAVTVDIAKARHRLAPTLRERLTQLKEGFTSLWPHRVLLATTVVANLAALGAGLAYYALSGELDAYERFGFINALMIVQAFAAGTIGVLYYREFWSRPDGDERPGAAGTLFWFGGGLALIWLAIDLFFGIHSALGEAMGEIPVAGYFASLFALAYLIAGVVFVRTFGHEVESHKPTLILLSIVVTVAIATIAIDPFIDSGNDLAALESAGQLLTVAFLLPAFAIKYLDLKRQRG